MKNEETGIDDLAREGLGLLTAARREARVANAIRGLRETDAYGAEVGRVPYSEEALRELAALQRQDPEDLEVVHHLAIAHHARAWDWELAGDSRAAAEWESALRWWRQLETSGEFWAGLKRRFVECGGAADAAGWVDGFRRTLLEQLLGIHADFICSYAETGETRRAMQHAALVRRAHLPPAARERLLVRVFGTMTAPVAEAMVRRDFDAARSAAVRFVELFPEHLPGLRLYAEICAEMLNSLANERHWPRIESESQYAGRVADQLAAHPRLDSDPLAVAALHELGMMFLVRVQHRGSPIMKEIKEQQATPELLNAAEAAFMLGLEWGRRLSGRSPVGGPLRRRHAECGKALANLMMARLEAESSTPNPPQNQRREAFLQRARDIIVETIQHCPEIPELRTGFLEPIEELLATIRGIR